MTTRDQELESLREEFENKEAGVADLMKLYERVEGIYVKASASMTESEVSHTSNSTDVVKPVAHWGSDSK